MENVDNAVQKELNAVIGVKSKKAKRTKPKAKKKPKRPAKPKRKAKKTVKRKAAKSRKKPARKTKSKAGGNVVRSERLDMRLTKAEKAKVNAKAKRTRRTVTSLIIEAIEKIR